MYHLPVLFLLSSLSLYLWCRPAFDRRSHTLSRGFDRKEEREKRLDEEEEKVSVTYTNLGCIP